MAHPTSGTNSAFSGSGFQNSQHMRQVQQMLPRSDTATGSTGPDPFADPEAYYEWMASVGMENMRRTAFTAGAPQGRHPSKVSSSDTSMPDYVSSHYSSSRMSICGVMPEPLMPQLAGGNHQVIYEDDSQATALKVPTNTPTAGGGEGADYGGNAVAPT
jgi:hypothetical protein